MDREKVIKAVEEAFDLVHSDFIGTDDFDEIEWEQNKADALALLKEQDAWIEQIADYQQSITGSGMHELTEYEQGKWDGLQIAWNIISEGR